MIGKEKEIMKGVIFLNSTGKKSFFPDTILLFIVLLEMDF
jgi:hypothetical protein